MNEKRHKNRHHIIPRSRGGKDVPDNTIRVNAKKHNLYHQLFGNMLPYEIVDYLNRTFWGGLWKG